jgi:hypothetical protein
MSRQAHLIDKTTKTSFFAMKIWQFGELLTEFLAGVGGE